MSGADGMEGGLDDDNDKGCDVVSSESLSETTIRFGRTGPGLRSNF